MCRRFASANLDLVMMGADTCELRAQAGRIENAAAEVRSGAERLQSAADHARWVSLAAGRYRAQTAALRGDLNAVADGLAHAAALLRAHANAADEAMHALLAVPTAAVHASEAVVSAGVHGVSSTVHALVGWL
jgi:uncharacterized protein YukE